jgi:uncharacterized membrane protein YhaH (DUF805 family)
MRPLQIFLLFFSCFGRISRQQFFLGLLALSLLWAFIPSPNSQIDLSALLELNTNTSLLEQLTPQLNASFWVGLGALLLVTYSGNALCMKRCRDCGRSQSFLVLSVFFITIPWILWVLLFEPSKDAEDTFS